MNLPEINTNLFKQPRFIPATAGIVNLEMS